MGNSKIFIDVIKQRRNEIDFTQKDLSYFSKVSINTIKQLESGRSGTSFKNISAIAEALNLPIDSIYQEDFRETKVITVINSKGGCSKTTVVQNVGYQISQTKKRVLIIDADLQCNLTNTFNMSFDKKNSIYQLLLETEYAKKVDLKNYIKKTTYENLDIIISDFAMARMDYKIYVKKYREQIVSQVVNEIVSMGKYDYLIFDCNPTLGLLNQNILLATNSIIIPVELSVFGVLGLEVLIEFIQECKVLNPELKIMGILKTKLDKRYNITKKANQTLRESFSDSSDISIMKTSISTDANVAKSQWESLPLSVYVKKNKVHSRAKDDFIQLAKEVMDYEH